MIPSRSLCECRTGDLYRIQRDPWMRVVFPWRRLYQCATCTTVMLISPLLADEARLERRQRARTRLAPNIAPQPATVA